MMDSTSSLWQSQDDNVDEHTPIVPRQPIVAPATVRLEISWLTYITVIVFGIGSWVAVNGIWVELPVLVNHAPEGMRLPSYLTVATQLANVAPLLYCLARIACPHVVHERTAVYVIVLIGSITCVLLAFLWDDTSTLFGGRHSAALIVLTFVLAMADCSSSVVFLPFMALYPKVYLSALYVGESSSGLIPGILALAQNIGHKVPYHCNTTISGCHNGTAYHYAGLRFQPVWFFMLLFVMMCSCGVAFILLNFHPQITRPQIRSYSQLNSVAHISNPSTFNNGRTGNTNTVYRQMRRNFHHDSSDDSSSSDDSLITFVEPLNYHRDKCLVVLCLVILIWINCLNTGVFSELQPFACAAYGPTVYHLASTLGAIAAALTSFLYIWIPTRSVTAICICTLLHSGAASYVTVLAVQNPNPILKGHTAGMVLAIGAFIWASILFSYIKLVICSLMSDLGRKGLLWCGIGIQAGSFVGAIMMFFVINDTSVFQSS